MTRSASDVRAELWARYDSGSLAADELDARLKAVDRAGADPTALEAALGGHVRIPRPRVRRAVLAGAGVLATAALVVGAVSVLSDGSGAGADDPRIGGPDVTIGPFFPEPFPVEPEPLDCPALDDALAVFEGIDQDEEAANPALLSEPASLPDGYTVSDEVTLIGGSDPDLSMGIAAGNPPPVDIRARTLLGPLVVTMRTFVYESAETAGESGLSVIDDAMCQYEADTFTVADRPEVTGSTVEGIIPTTAFASWRLAERRYTVSVVAAFNGDAESRAEAEALAGLIAGLELDAARTAP